jgi:hypothetical protein
LLNESGLSAAKTSKNTAITAVFFLQAALSVEADVWYCYSGRTHRREIAIPLMLAEHVL